MMFLNLNIIMIKNSRKMTTKTILFASLIVAMILPFSAMNFAEADSANNEKYTAEDIKNAMQKAGSYITQEDNIVIFDSNTAKQTMSNHEIKIIKDFVKMQNDYVEKVKENPNKKHSFDSEINSKFSELKKQVKKSKSQINDVDYISKWILPEAFAWTDVCGGSFDNPHDEYEKKTIYSTSSQSTAVSIVEAWGYVSVAPYASDPTEWFNPNSLDYGREMSYYNCNFGAFRDQIVLDNDGDWDFNKQIKEPNPSFLDYASPVWWWIWYTAEWHYPGLDQDVVSW